MVQKYQNNLMAKQLMPAPPPVYVLPNIRKKLYIHSCVQTFAFGE